MNHQKCPKCLRYYCSDNCPQCVLDNESQAAPDRQADTLPVKQQSSEASIPSDASGINYFVREALKRVRERVEAEGVSLKRGDCSARYATRIYLRILDEELEKLR